jgi:hypothetical protein
MNSSAKTIILERISVLEIYRLRIEKNEMGVSQNMQLSSSKTTAVQAYFSEYVMT